MATSDHWVGKLQSKLSFEVDPELIAAIIVILTAISEATQARFIRRARRPGWIAGGRQIASACKQFDSAGFDKPFQKAVEFCRAFREVASEMDDKRLGEVYNELTDINFEEEEEPTEVKF